MSFLAAIGAFAVSAFVLVWAHDKSLIGSSLAALLAVVFIIMGLTYPFYNAFQAKRTKLDGSEGKDTDAVDKAVKSLTDAAKALQGSKA